MLVFDITKQKSFDNITKWIGNIEMVSVCNTYNILYYHIIISLYEYRLMLWVGLIVFVIFCQFCLYLHLPNTPLIQLAHLNVLFIGASLSEPHTGR